MKLYLAAGPEETAGAGKTGLPLAVMGYRAESTGRLLVREGPGCRGELLALDASAFTAPDRCGALAGAVLAEVREAGFGGVLLDLGGNKSAAGQQLCRLLSAGLEQRPFFAAGERVPDGVCALTETGVSRGILAAKLRQEVRQRGAAGLAADLQRLRREYLLPAGNGKGRDLSGEELRQRLEQYRPSVRFSRELCAHYFTWSRDGETRFVLFDDAVSLRRKLQLAASLGIGQGFLLWHEVRDIIAGLLPPGRSF